MVPARGKIGNQNKRDANKQKKNQKVANPNKKLFLFVLST
jgi:hypothetical protein